MNTQEKLLIKKLTETAAEKPKHIAIIMDGNGRWANRKGLPRYEGHREGVKRIEPILDVCRKIGVPVVTLYAFSTENWNRPEKEVKVIMELLARTIDEQTPRLVKNRVRQLFIGDTSMLSPELQKRIKWGEEQTAKDYVQTLNICVNYGGRAEILSAVRNMVDDARSGGLNDASINEETFSKYLYTSETPNPDLLIRTGGEQRISNFLLWQAAYAEIMFHPRMWPEFSPLDLLECVDEYITRERRFGAARESSMILAGISSPDDLKKLTPPEMEKLAEEIRETIINVVSSNGGHLAPNLGVVELSIALHRVFDSPRDQIVWDVGHQCYAHKLLTGRFQEFANLRKRGGISGFPKRSESEHDAFSTGHGSTSMSAAIGLATGRDMNGEQGDVVCVCGDGSMAGGMFLEALNHAGDLNKKLILVLNDNRYCISPNTGGLSKYLCRIRTTPTYVHLQQILHDLSLEKSKTLNRFRLFSQPLRKLAKYFVLNKGMVFEELGYKYIGPIDGHNIGDMISVLDKVRNIRTPVVVHILTQKGRGYGPAEDDPVSFHGVSSIAKGQKRLDIMPRVSFTEAFSESLMEIARDNPKVAGVTAAMSVGTGMQSVIEEYPERFFDVGMAEQHAVTFAAGLAAKGWTPVVAIYSTFLQRAYDQIFHDVCLQKLPVVFAIDRGGLVDRYGETHQGLLDFSYMRNLPGITVMAPADTDELKDMMRFAVKLGAPVSLRYPGAADPRDPRAAKAVQPIEYGKSAMISEGRDLMIWAVGPLVYNTVKAAASLKEIGVSAGVVNARFVQPLDVEAIREQIKKGVRRFVTVEEHCVVSGMGSAFLEFISDEACADVSVLRLGVNDLFVADETRQGLIEEYGLSPEGIHNSVLNRFFPADARNTTQAGK